MYKDQRGVRTLVVTCATRTYASALLQLAAGMRTGQRFSPLLGSELYTIPKFYQCKPFPSLWISF